MGTCPALCISFFFSHKAALVWSHQELIAFKRGRHGVLHLVILTTELSILQEPRHFTRLLQHGCVFQPMCNSFSTIYFISCPS